jgi:hypothetical protein
LDFVKAACTRFALVGPGRESKMPRKQRFKPSRKPKVIGTPADQVVSFAIETTRSTETSPVDIESDGRGRRDSDVFTSTRDIGGESS